MHVQVQAGEPAHRLHHHLPQWSGWAQTARNHRFHMGPVRPGLLGGIHCSPNRRARSADRMLGDTSTVRSRRLVKAQRSAHREMSFPRGRPPVDPKKARTTHTPCAFVHRNVGNTGCSAPDARRRGGGEFSQPGEALRGGGEAPFPTRGSTFRGWGDILPTWGSG